MDAVITEVAIITRLMIAAGLRTHMILVTGSALAMIVLIDLATPYRGVTASGDPARLAAQVLPRLFPVRNSCYCQRI